jgi:hypothetical protein
MILDFDEDEKWKVISLRLIAHCYKSSRKRITKFIVIYNVPMVTFRNCSEHGVVYRHHL